MTLIPRRWRLPYVALLTVVALLLSASALEAYRLGGGTRPWEPFLWEFSSIAVIGVLVLGIHALVGWLQGRPWPQQLATHALALPLFSVLHIAGMFGLRLLVYGLVGVDYRPDGIPTLLVFEGGKDAVSYISFCLISRGVWMAQAAAQARVEVAELRLARLADQVQPHFLFNTLNLISSVMYEDVARADRLLCQLADLLRQTLAAQQRVEHTVREELALVEPFLALMQARFGPQRLVVQIDAEDAAQDCRLPALLLLAPVENAVKHDVARHLGRVTVVVAATVEGGWLRLRVSNHGDRPVPEPQPDPDGGLGLRNLRERLQARYGGAARVDFGPDGDGMSLTVSVPCVC
ncbi:histidine kinase [Roseateles asaccharophilus]|uniref:Signal transduction histidine kinase n=1 Tax=Roseateles asaccharophilus TaxID=582607 RepID=A0ABU2AB99_9BURK|nr:histidine kinase [Roseateles asaccharophilus]MDR7333288.1 signal transduction histidine kinase [Roseateles asaccharophilus]